MSNRSVELVLHPREVITAKEAKRFPPFSIFVDGYATGGPFMDRETPLASFDHHNEVIRSITMATWQQLHLATTAELFQVFRRDGVPYAVVHANDPDPDVFGSWYSVSRYPHHNTRPVRRLMDVTGKLDMLGGWLPDISLDAPVLRQLAWITQPYWESRLDGELSRMSAAGMIRVIEAGCARIDEHVFGRGGEIPLDGERVEYRVLYRSPHGFAVVEEHGFYARMKMRADGIRHFISVRPGADPSRKLYSNGFLTIWPSREIPSLLRQFAVLSAREARAGGTAIWNGSDLIGGGPWNGSVLPIEAVVEELEALYVEQLAGLVSDARTG
ncbi:MAG: hypothetical protein Q8O56_06025 [Solirubrobacteraceae bacterium]|nr:hypothetical protein [Solirubrobacteraceae bacterium]